MGEDNGQQAPQALNSEGLGHRSSDADATEI